MYVRLYYKIVSKDVNLHPTATIQLKQTHGHTHTNELAISPLPPPAWGRYLTLFLLMHLPWLTADARGSVRMLSAFCHHQTECTPSPNPFKWDQRKWGKKNGDRLCGQQECAPDYSETKQLSPCALVYVCYAQKFLACPH